MSRAPLRLGLLVDSLVQPAWVRRLVEEIHGSDVARITLVVRKATAAGSRERAARGKRAGALLYRLYARVDRWAFPVRPDPLQPCDLSRALADVPVFDVVAHTTPAGDALDAADIERVRAHDLDVALSVGFGNLHRHARSIARFGVWSYRHAEVPGRGGAAPGFWEVMEREPSTAATLEMLSDDPDTTRVLYASRSATHRLSVNQNRLAVYWKASTFVMRTLREVHHQGAAALDRRPMHDVTASIMPPRPGPTNATMVRLLGRLASRYATNQLRAHTQYPQWTLAYRFARSASDAPDLDLHGFRILEPPADRFWADPFVEYAGGRHYVFFEDCGYAPRRGRIAVLELTPGGTPSAPVPVLERDYHLSYPFLFRWRGEHFMIPESGANRTVDVYRATRFPHEWTLETTMFSGRQLVDVTLGQIGGHWWLFANAPAAPEVPYESAAWDELHLFYADSPLGPWQPHPRNPIVSDVRHARPAGRLFQDAGVWYRPAQDCAGSYGRRLAIQRIVRLDMQDYEEVPATILTPTWLRGLDGIHTINAAGGLTVVDVRRQRWKSPFPKRSPRNTAPQAAALASRLTAATPPPREPAAHLRSRSPAGPASS